MAGPLAKGLQDLLLVLSQGILRPQPGAAEQFLERVRGEGLFQVVDGPVNHTLRGQDPLDLAALASGRLLINRNLWGCHFTPSLAQSFFCVTFDRHLILTNTHTHHIAHTLMRRLAAPVLACACRNQRPTLPGPP